MHILGIWFDYFIIDALFSHIKFDWTASLHPNNPGVTAWILIITVTVDLKIKGLLPECYSYRSSNSNNRTKTGGL